MEIKKESSIKMKRKKRIEK